MSQLWQQSTTKKDGNTSLWCTRVQYFQVSFRGLPGRLLKIKDIVTMLSVSESSLTKDGSVWPQPVTVFREC